MSNFLIGYHLGKSSGSGQYYLRQIKRIVCKNNQCGHCTDKKTAQKCIKCKKYTCHYCLVVNTCKSCINKSSCNIM